ncbi:C40 family peptidase [Paenibacillus sp. SC116]|uniref:C40 family peptidase n=1 Tax=Paenibacillus sp. SC116 TaxID=2968986 RepID=UPI00215A252F|nr:SH3 domain-containing C40 family peptidase [Paenibacillus sp. SC116]MCR8844190.1 C40 family peptidase [Paenibacillus sp. SC116]
MNNRVNKLMNMKTFSKSLLALTTITLSAQMLAAPVSAAPRSTDNGTSYSYNMNTAASTAQTATIQSSVNMRDAASTSGKVIRKLTQGEAVSVLEQTSANWYKVKDSQGNIGFVSSSSKYIKVNGTSNPSTGSSNSVNANNSNNDDKQPISSSVEDVIKTGMSYLGTPYEFGSNRSNTQTFDCSDFVRHIFKQSAGVTLPADSRQQGSYVKNKGTAKNSISQLKRGDLMFFMSYKGSKASSYAGVNKNTERITHVGVYLGDGQVLHTYSIDSGGVRVDTITGKAWEHRFLFGGSVI